MAGETKHVRVGIADLDAERLDTGFYSAAYFSARDALSSFGPQVQSIGQLCEPWSFGAYALTSEIEWTDMSGIPFLKAESLDSPLLDEDALSYVTEATHRRLKKSQAGPGDIVVSTSGTVGRVAVVPAAMPRVNSNQDTIKFNPSSAEIDNHFVAVQLCSSLGQALMNREAGGAVQQHIYLYNFRRLPLLLPIRDVQSYIGGKVREAEALRTAARSTLMLVESRQRRLIPVLSSGTKKGSTRVGVGRIAERLDAEFYPGEVDVYFDEYQGLVTSLEALCTAVLSGTTLPTTEGAGVFQATVANLSATFLEAEFRRVKAPTRSDKQVQDGDLLICAAAHNASYIGKDITFATTGGKTIVPSTEVLLVRPDRNKVPSSYLRAYLESPIGYLQIQACVRGISAHLYPADLSMIRVPVPAVVEAERAEWFALDDALVTAAEQQRSAKLLTTAARLLVEALIERRLTEADLITAHKNPEADRALLQRLTPEGIDAPNAPPLFPDLDRLASLLAEAQTEDAS